MQVQEDKYQVSPPWKKKGFSKLYKCG